MEVVVRRRSDVSRPFFLRIKTGRVPEGRGLLLFNHAQRVLAANLAQQLLGGRATGKDRSTLQGRLENLLSGGGQTVVV